GSPPPLNTLLRSIEEADFLIAADGGAKHCAALDIVPDLLIGDFDSVPSDLLKELRAKTILYKFPRDKDFTDLKLALLECERRKADQIEVFSWADERLDYSLSAIFSSSMSRIPIEFISHRSSVYILNEHRREFLISDSGSKISIYPIQMPISLKTEGLKWNFEWTNQTRPGFSQSNQTVSDAKITLSEGAAFLLIERTHE
ncbi:MAG: hypothetical protein JWQ35_2307, partial [Bacteriovoracaceae bacterium]|nr:hypothetical protein [Bacteriovoracaceae bacterium]